MIRASHILAIPAWLYRWSNKLLLHIWIGLPLLGALIGMWSARSEWTDVHEKAVSTPSFWQEGVITRPDLKGNTLRLRMEDGSARPILCNIGSVTTSYCLYGIKLPIHARVEIFDYRGIWMILTVIDMEKNVEILGKEKQLKYYKNEDGYNATLTPEHGFYKGLALGIIVIPFGLLYHFYIKWMRRIAERRKLAEMGTLNVEQ